MAKDAETSKPKHLNPTSEYYLSSQANSGNSLSKDTLKGDNYVAWEQSAILTLKSHNKLAFIDGRITKPDPKSEDFLAWDIVNSPLCSWICNSLDPPIRATMSRLNEAKLICDSLKTRYSIPNRPRIYKLWSDASMTTHGGASVMTYYTKLLGMWDELLTFSPLESCGCPKGTEKMNWYQDLRTYQFLMGLDDKYATLCTQIINMDPFPNIDRVYAMVVQEESHRGITGHHFEESDWTGGDTPPATGGDLPPSPAATPSSGLSGITVGPDPEISSPASPPSSPTAPSPTLGGGKRQKKAPSVLKDYVCHTAQVLPPASSTPTNGSSGPRYHLATFVSSPPALHSNSILTTTLSSKTSGLSSIWASKQDVDRVASFSQRKYALDILSESGLSASKPAAFPMEQNHGLALAGGPLLSDPGPYRRLIGRLVYLTITRPDICYVIHFLSQFMQSPHSQHWETALRVLQYLKAVPGQGLFLLADSPLQIYAFYDSDWASCPLTRRSVTGYFVSLGNSLISWHTKKQPTVSRSSAEAEYRSMAVTTYELTWLKSFLLSLGVHHDCPMRLFCDNQVALHIASNLVFHERTKHIEIDCHYVREQLLVGNISTAHVRTAQQVADIFTKALGRHQFHYLCGKLGSQNLHAPT
ncbi:hypothetical protein RJ639_011582 [Escallonia herrerae]|uniref:Retrotransposon Copia-like N-terminal domain-containing protein n=1 Tax=Escallonia herrerae TaxID=1293975 RepID=A0AA88VNT3_9ASTE|nr:hypothetical protein RJ639_011582 [Escallonia herrerae]